MLPARRRAGFTIPEILIVLVLGSLVLGAMYHVFRFQQRIYRQHRAVIARDDALRLASSVLAADLMEANGAAGDIASMTADSVSLRSYVGFAIVCAASANQTVALFDLAGRIDDSAGDSLLVYHPSGWLVRAIQEIDPPGAPPLDCPYGGNPSAQLRARLDGSVVGIPVGAPLRAFHRYTYRLEQEQGSWWLARDDGGSVELLAGPFSGDGSGLAFAYLDSAAQPTADPSLVARVDVTLIADGGDASARLDTLIASVRPRNQ